MKRAREGKRRMRHCGLSALLACSHLACAAPDINAVAASCAQQTLIEHHINIGSGVNNEQVTAAAPLSIIISGGRDARAYADCLRREGFDPRQQVAASFTRASDCLRQSQGPVRLSQDEHARLLGREIDVAALRDCLDHDIEVEVIPDLD